MNSDGVRDYDLAEDARRDGRSILPAGICKCDGRSSDGDFPCDRLTLSSLHRSKYKGMDGCLPFIDRDILYRQGVKTGALCQYRITGEWIPFVIRSL